MGDDKVPDSLRGCHYDPDDEDLLSLSEWRQLQARIAEREQLQGKEDPASVVGEHGECFTTTAGPDGRRMVVSVPAPAPGEPHCRN